jgi:hypothetical protein
VPVWAWWQKKNPILPETESVIQPIVTPSVTEYGKQMMNFRDLK